MQPLFTTFIRRRGYIAKNSLLLFVFGNTESMKHDDQYLRFLKDVLEAHTVKSLFQLFTDFSVHTFAVRLLSC